MKKWESSRPEQCDMCKKKLEDFDGSYFVDGKTLYGPWAIMCQFCHKCFGAGLGIGKGQKYNIHTLEKIEG